MIVANAPAISELTTAAETAGLAAASPNHLSVNPAGGQVGMRLVLNA